MRRIIILSLIVVFVSNCKEYEEELNCASGNSNYLPISFVDKEGNSLLDIENPNAFEFSEIEIYKIVDEVKYLMVEKGSFEPFFESGDKIFLFMFPLHYEYPIENNIYNTYIQLNKTDIDTVECEYGNKKCGGITPYKVWYNEVLIYDHEITYSNYPEIIK